MTQSSTHAHPIVQLCISDNFRAISFLGDSNLIQLGDTIVLITSILQKFYHTLGQVKVSFKNSSSEKEVLDSDSSEPSEISYYLPCQYIELIFDYLTQRLKKIVLKNVNKLILSYRNKYFSHPRQSLAPNLKEIDAVFGSTKPGKIDSKTNSYILDYDKHAYKLSGEEENLNLKKDFNENQDSFSCQRSGSLLQFIFNNNNDTSSSSSTKIKVHNKLVCSEINLIAQTSSSKLRTGILSEACPIILEKLYISNSQQNSQNYTLKFNLFNLKSPTDTEITFFTRQINSHDHVQIVESELGCPNEIFFKSEHEHLTLSNNDQNSASTDFYYNYYDFGLDVLFSGQTKTVKKFILHTCVFEHEEFGRRYSPCNFEFLKSGLNSRSRFGDEIVEKLVKSNLMLLSRNNQVSDSNTLKSLISITGSSKSSGFLYQSNKDNEIYEFTSSGRLALVTIY